MASITIRNLSSESKERLRLRAASRGCSLEALVRSILDQAACDPVSQPQFPHNLMAIVEPGRDLGAFLEGHDQPQEILVL